MFWCLISFQRDKNINTDLNNYVLSYIKNKTRRAISYCVINILKGGYCIFYGRLTKLNVPWTKICYRKYNNFPPTKHKLTCKLKTSYLEFMLS